MWEYVTVLEGTLLVETEEDEILIEKGNTARFLADINHTYSNKRKEPVKYQVILSSETER